MTDRRRFEHAIPALLLAAAAAMLAACGSPPPRSPLAMEQAAKADQAAYRALRDGDLLRARELFRQSMLMHQSIENAHAAATAELNLATLNHKLGNDDEALRQLAEIVSDPNQLVPAEVKATAAFRKAIVLADSGKIDEVEAMLQTARALCHGDCPWGAGMSNLQARLLLNRGDHGGALAIANSVLRTGAERDEQANAYRIAAAAELALEQAENAKQHYYAALQLDKDLALSARIADDLEGMGKALLQLGNINEANMYARRAADVRNALRQLNVQRPPRLAP